MQTKFWLEDFKGRDHLEELDVYDLNIRIDLRKIEWKCVDWINLDQDRDQWQIL
jgi:hypothetical protein